MLKRLEVECEGTLDAGCCGLAGSFGFESEKYGLSMQIGEQRLLPAVREATRDTLIVADGFSCRHQIEEATDRKALHLAQVMQMALREGPDGPPGGYPEVRYPEVILDGPARLGATVRTAAILGAGALLVGASIWAIRRRGQA